MHNIYRINRPKILKADHCEVYVLKEKEIEASKETKISKVNNKKLESYLHAIQGY